MSTNVTHSPREQTPAKTSCGGENWDPEALVVNVGSTRLSVASATSVASAEPVPSALNRGTPCRSAPTSSESPTTPFIVIIAAANTVSRASVSALWPPETIRVRISATSITVTATASTRDPKGSPTRWAITSAWCTAASTAPARSTATSATTPGPTSRPQVATRATSATTGATRGQVRARVRGAGLMAQPCQTARSVSG